MQLVEILKVGSKFRLSIDTTSEELIFIEGALKTRVSGVKKSGTQEEQDRAIKVTRFFKSLLDVLL